MGRSLDKQEAIPMGILLMRSMRCSSAIAISLLRAGLEGYPVPHELVASKLFRLSSREAGFPNGEPACSAATPQIGVWSSRVRERS